MATVSELRQELDRAGYYPDLVADIVETAVAGEPFTGYLVLPETTFRDVELRRHVTVLVLTPTRLIVAHVDDMVADSERPAAAAAATTESISLNQIRAVALTRVLPDPAAYRSGETSPMELTLAISWGAVSRVDLEPAACDDPHCQADHGMTGSITPDDLAVRVSAAAEGKQAVAAALQFAQILSQATVR